MNKSKTPDILIIQLGDKISLLQTLHALRGQSSLNIFLVVKRDIANGLAGQIEEITNNILSVESDNFVTDLKKMTFAVAINLTFNKSSAYLNSFVSAKFKLGFRYNQKNQLKILDSWTNYIYSFLMGGHVNPFSRVDIFKSIIGIKECPKKKPTKSIQKIIFAPGEEKDIWEAIVISILEQNYKVEISIAQNAEFLKGQYVDRITYLKESPSDIKFSDFDLYIGYPGPFAHLCAFYDIDCITLFTGEYLPFFDAPYGEGNINVIPKEIEKSDLIASLALLKINQVPLDLPLHSPEVEIFRSFKGNGYFLNFENLTDAPADLKNCFREFYRFIFELTLEDIEEHFYVPDLSKDSIRELLHYKTGINSSLKICEFGKKYCAQILNELRKKEPEKLILEELCSKFDEIDHLFTSLGQNFIMLVPLFEYFKVEKNNLDGKNLVSFTENLFLSFEDFSLHLNVLNELIGGIKDGLSRSSNTKILS